MRKFMKLKSITALVLAIALVFSSFATVYAADETPGSGPTETELVEVGQDSPGVLGDEHTHCFCGGNCDTATAANGHTCGSITYEPWSGEVTPGILPEGTNAYYLEDDTTLKGSITMRKDTTLYLCLNGHMLTGATNSRIVMMYDDSASDAGKNTYLYICDCSAEKTGVIQGTGKTANNDGGMFAVTRGAHFYLFGGTIQGGGLNITSDRKSLGGILNIAGGCEAFMYGGTIKDGTISVNRESGKNSVFGANVCVSGTFIMYDGEISGGTLDTVNAAVSDARTGSQAGNVRVESDGKFLMKKGTIKDGDAQKGNGGNLSVGGLFIMEDGLITGGKSGTNADVNGVSGNFFTNGAGAVLSFQGGTVTGRINPVISKEVAVSGTAVINDHTADAKTYAGIYFNNTTAGRSNHMGVGKYDMNGTRSEAHLSEGADVVISYFNDTVDTTGLVLKGGNDADRKYVRLGANGTHKGLTEKTEGTAGLYLTTQTHCFCGGNCEAATVANGHTCADSITWEIITNFSSPAAREEGRYLAFGKDLTLSSGISWGTGTKSIYFCLNGFSFTVSTNRFALAYTDGLNGKLVICDCVGTGKIISKAVPGSGSNSTNGGLLGVGKGSSLEIYGGTIQGGVAGGSANGYGGNIACFGTGSSTVKIYGGVIENGYAETRGGNIAMESGSLYLYGGTIRNGKSGAQGGNIYFNGTEFYMGPGVTVEGGLCGQQTADPGATGAQGGNIFIAKGKATIAGGSILNGECQNIGANIVVNAATVRITGGKVSGSKKSGNVNNVISIVTTTSQAVLSISGNPDLDGVDPIYAADFSISGSPVIGNLYLTRGSANRIKDQRIGGLDASGNKTDAHLSEGASINIGGLDSYAAPAGMVFRNGNADDIKYITVPKQDGKALQVKTGQKDSGGFFYGGAEFSGIFFASTTAPHTHCICGGNCDAATAANGHTCDATQEWESIDAWNSLNVGSSKRYVMLSKDMTSQAKPVMAVGGELYLCLNGHTLTVPTNQRLIMMWTDGTPKPKLSEKLVICDCQGGGKIVSSADPTKGEQNGNNGGLLVVGQGSTLEIYGGTISGGVALQDANGYGGNIAVFSDDSTTGGSTVKIYGGTIENGYAKNFGGNIAMITTLSKLYIYGGTIKDGTAEVKYGGNIYAAGEVVINGGTIEGGISGTFGGNISEIGGTLTLNGGSVLNGVAGTNGGNIMVGDAGNVSTNSHFVMNGGLVKGGNAKYGGNIAFSAYRKSLTITGGEISEGTSSDIGGNIYVSSTTDVKIGNDDDVEGLVIKDGVSTGAAGGNIYLSASAKADFTKATIKGGIAKTYGGNILLNNKLAAGEFDGKGGFVTFTGTLIEDGKANGSGESSYGGNITINNAADVTINEGTVIRNGITTGLTANIRALGWNGRAKITVNGGEIGGGSCWSGGSIRLENAELVVNDGIFLHATQTGSDHTVSNISVSSRTSVAPGVECLPAKFTITGGYFNCEDISHYGIEDLGNGQVRDNNGKTANAIHVDSNAFDSDSEVSGGYIGKLFVHPNNPNRKVITGGYFQSTGAVYLKDAEPSLYFKELQTPVTYAGYDASEEFGYTISQGYKVSLSAKAIAGSINVSGLQGAGWYDAGDGVTLLLPYENNGYTLQYLMVGDEKVEAKDVEKDEHGICSYVIEGLSADVTVNAYYAFQVESVYLNVDAANFILDGIEYSGPQEDILVEVGQHTIQYVGENFKYWMNKSGNVVSRSPLYAVNLGTDMDLTAVTSAGTATVVFLSDCGQILKTVITSEESEAFEFPAAPYHVGKKATWAICSNREVVANSAAVWEKADQGATYIELIAQYEKDTDAKGTVKLYKVVTDLETIDEVELSTDTCVDTTEIDLGEVGSITAPAAETGETLLGIYTAEKRVASRTADFSLRVINAGEVGYYAVYTTAEVTPAETPIIRMLDLAIVDQGSDKFTFIYTASHMAGDDFEVVERGILFTNQNRIDGYNESLAPGETALTPSAALKYNFVNSVCSKYVANYACNTGTITLNLKNVPSATYGDVTFQAVGYLVYTLNGKQYITYSDVQSACINDFVN